MSKYITISPSEAADRLAIRELVEAYAHCADRRDAKGQMALFTTDTHFVVYMNGQAAEPTQILDGRESLTPVFEDLNRYQATQHFNGQSTIELDGDRATGESYCIAHHLFTEDGERKLMLAHLRYGDTFVKLDGAWLFAERNLIRLPRKPELLLAFTVQPIMFVLLFRYVFGGAINTGGIPYVDYLIPGIIVQNIAFGGFVTAIGLNEDVHKGLIDKPVAY